MQKKSEFFVFLLRSWLHSTEGDGAIGGNDLLLHPYLRVIQKLGLLQEMAKKLN